MMDESRWWPVASSGDLPVGHIYQARLNGQLLAIWRSANGLVNIWEDRCPHRGVRFSLGTAMADELRCQYHAWSFASGTGACTRIPAQPGQKPAEVIRAKVWPTAERGGLVWTALAGAAGQLPHVPDGLVIRALPVNCPAEVVTVSLAEAAFNTAALFVQPLDPGACVIRGIARDEAELLMLDAALERLRRDLESDDHDAL